MKNIFDKMKMCCPFCGGKICRHSGKQHNCCDSGYHINTWEECKKCNRVISDYDFETGKMGEGELLKILWKLNPVPKKLITDYLKWQQGRFVGCGRAAFYETLSPGWIEDNIPSFKKTEIKEIKCLFKNWHEKEAEIKDFLYK